MQFSANDAQTCDADDTEDVLNRAHFSDGSAEETREENPGSRLLLIFNLKPLYILGSWRHPRTRDGRLPLVVVLPTGAIVPD